MINLIITMVCGEGGTIESLAQTHVDLCFSFEPKGTKKSIEDILRERSISNPNVRSLCKQEAEKMVDQRCLLYDNEGKWVFSKDEQKNYSWEPARIKDRVVNLWKRYF